MPVQIVGDNAAEGVSLGSSATALAGMHGSSAAQPSGGANAAVVRGSAAGSITTYSTTQSPSIVNTITGGERAFTVQTGTGATMLPTAGDFFLVNKPTSQAGLGVGNVRVSASNTVQVGFINLSAGNITPTGSEVYQLVGVRGLPTLSAVLSPVAVLANTSQEQQFSVPGLPAGALVAVSKPTNQAGLEIGGCRVVSNNVLGITFVNPTAGSITPTAAETYTVFFTAGLDAANNDLVYGYNVGTVGAIGAGLVTTGGSTAVQGVLATDVPIGAPMKPTSGAAATNAAFPALSVLSANAITTFFAGIGTGATPTASEVYNQKVHRLNPAAPLAFYNTLLTPASVAANTTVEQTFTVTGLVANSPVWINKTSAQPGLSILGCRVSATNTLAITYGNTSAAAIVPASETYVIGDFQTVAPGAGNSVYQSVVVAFDRVVLLANAIRAGLVAKGIIAGS